MDGGGGPICRYRRAMTQALAETSRRRGLDLLRFIGIAAVVAGHVRGTSGAASLTVMVTIYSWHVPLFFVLSGYLFHTGRPLLIELRTR